MFSTETNHWLQEFDNVIVNWLLNIVTLLGFVPFLLLIVLVIIAAVNYRYGFLVVNFLGWTVIATILLKEAINYPRPIEVDKTLQNFLLFSEDIAGDIRGDNVGKSGFPSGHTAFQTAIWVGLSLFMKKRPLWIASIIIIILTIISRLYLAHHFLADVIAGLGIGLAVTFILYWIMKKAELDKSSRLSVNHYLFFLAPLLLVFFYPLMPVAQLGRFIGINLAFVTLTYVYGIPTLHPSLIKRICNFLVFLLFYALFFALSVWVKIPGNGVLIILYYALFNLIPISIAALTGKKLGLMNIE